ncbi:MAG: glycosyltransferase family 4 protein [Cycloclasticus sp.]|uniref:glycosyltransferase family 4 protein n=1 Tax=Cycloclasticus sp. TaxID=2024830 RepID=UPI00257E8E61|nr:glycosyltransferase family 4 protein [Cycloclasticus sp.]MBV1899654.1 glycosyltransferase family 4 protein [Cycloclasticus sp.]
MNIKQTTEVNNQKNLNNLSLFTVGIINPGYGYERVSYALSHDDFDFKRLYTLPLYKLLKAQTNFYRETPLVMDVGVDLLHTWNSLPLCRKPFIVSYECELPRYLGNVKPWQLNFGKKILRSNRCRKILALSEAAKNRLTLSLTEPDDDKIINKIDVFRGGVSLPISPKETYSTTGPLNLLFVGTDAMRKGIVPLFYACEELIRQGLDIKLTFIGGFSEACYVYGEHLPDIAKLESLLRSANWVEYKGRVPINTVFEEMKASDVLLFPTFDESLGWVPIEAGLLGVPTIATDIFALPELIDNGKTGRLISIDKRDDRRFVGLNTTGDTLKNHLDTANADIQKGLSIAIQDMYANRHIVEKYGRAARIKLGAMYGADKAALTIKKIYEKNECLL